MNTPALENAHVHTSEEVMQALATSIRGLNTDQVHERQLTYGPNEVTATDRRSWVSLVVKQFRSWLVGVLLIAAVISWLVGHIIDMWVITVVVLVNAGIGFFQEYRAEKAIEALKRQIVKITKVMRNGELMTVPSQSLVPGDLIILEEGDHVPADARIVEARNLRNVEASLTGESMPVSKHGERAPLLFPEISVCAVVGILNGDDR